MTKNDRNTFNTKSSNISIEFPFFIPVYRPDYSFNIYDEEFKQVGLKAIMVNSFLLYRNSSTRKMFGVNNYDLRTHIGNFDGVVCTDSGAFQQLGGKKVEIDPIEIVKFQNLIKTDVAAPLDLITPPNTSYDETYKRMVVSHYRIEEALKVTDYSHLAGIQQGGGFFSLRQKHIRMLEKLDLEYYGIGSMVPFFNKNHNLHFTCHVIKDAREVIGDQKAMHIYGAGDPLDIVFMYKAGANVFDSSSYAHYARAGYYMTPYGSIKKVSHYHRLGYECLCSICSSNSIETILHPTKGIELRKQHNLYTILNTLKNIRTYEINDCLDKYVDRVYCTHVNNKDIFKNSELEDSWERFLRNESFNEIEETRKKIFIKNVTEENQLEFEDIELMLIEHLSHDLEKSYKISFEDAKEYIIGELLLPKNKGVRVNITKYRSLKQALKTSEYKKFRKNTRSSLYLNLRQYKTSDYDIEAAIAELLDEDSEYNEVLIKELLSKHISTKERLPFKDEMIKSISANIKKDGIVLDVGCGFNPMLFDREFYSNISMYIAVDKDTEAVELINVYAKRYDIKNLKAFYWNIEDGVEKLKEVTGFDKYDLALMFKIIPVIHRADQNYLQSDKSMMSILGEVPADIVFATVSRESMTKHKSIEKRELGILKKFISMNNLSQIEDFACSSEIGYYLEK